MPTASLPVTRMPSPAEWPLTSADGELTRRYSAPRSASTPSEKRTTSRRERFFSVISTGSGASAMALPRQKIVSDTIFLEKVSDTNFRSENIAGQVLVLDELAEVSVDVGRVDRDGLAGTVRGLERDRLEEALE